MLGWAATAQAQTKPAVTSLGPDFPKSEIFIGNSFFYYNNGLPDHVSLLEKAADPDHKQDYRATMVTIGGSGFELARCRELFPAQRDRLPIPSTNTTTSSSTSPASCSMPPS